MVKVLRESAYECTSQGDEFSCSPCPVGYMGRDCSLEYDDSLGPVCIRCPAGLVVLVSVANILSDECFLPCLSLGIFRWILPR